MPCWIDPRQAPDPQWVRPVRQLATEPREIAQLLELCASGKLYQVERWIASGRPLQVAYRGMDMWSGTKSPLIIAIESHQHDLALLLLCNGYKTSIEPRSTLELVLRRRAWDLLELLLEWGAEPTEVDPEVVLDTYRIALMERFWEAGVDYTKDHCLAHYLAEATRNLPAYGWAKRHASDPRVALELTLALGSAVSGGNAKATSLLRWAGADPHRPVPSLRWSPEDDNEEDCQSAIYVAVRHGYGALLRVLKPDPARVNLDALLPWICDPHAADWIAAALRPADWSSAIAHCLGWMCWSSAWSEDDHARECLERIFDAHGGRLNAIDRSEYRELRWGMRTRYGEADLAWTLRALAQPKHCEPAIFKELTRTPAMQERMREVGLSVRPRAKTVARRRRSGTRERSRRS